MNKRAADGVRAMHGLCQGIMGFLVVTHQKTGVAYRSQQLGGRLLVGNGLQQQTQGLLIPGDCLGVLAVVILLR